MVVLVGRGMVAGEWGGGGGGEDAERGGRVQICLHH